MFCLHTFFFLDYMSWLINRNGMRNFNLYPASVTEVPSSFCVGMIWKVYFSSRPCLKACDKQLKFSSWSDCDMLNGPNGSENWEVTSLFTIGHWWNCWLLVFLESCNYQNLRNYEINYLIKVCWCCTQINLLNMEKRCCVVKHPLNGAFIHLLFDGFISTLSRFSRVWRFLFGLPHVEFLFCRSWYESTWESRSMCILWFYYMECMKWR